MTTATIRTWARPVAVGLLASLAILGGGRSASAQGPFGTIKGRLVYGGAKAPEPKVLYQKNDPTAKDPQVCATEPIIDRDVTVDPKTKGIMNGYAYLLKPSGSNPAAEQALLAKEAAVEIDQKNCRFLPFSTALHQKQKLVFKSSDPVNHNVRYSAFTNTSFNQILPPSGETTVQLVAESRALPLACDIHPWMKGYIMVFDHPFFDVTEEDGSFEIQGVPAGEQKLIVWWGPAGYVSEGARQGMAVTVKAGEVTDVGEIKSMPKP